MSWIRPGYKYLYSTIIKETNLPVNLVLFQIISTVRFLSIHVLYRITYGFRA